MATVPQITTTCIGSEQKSILECTLYWNLKWMCYNNRQAHQWTEVTVGTWSTKLSSSTNNHVMAKVPETLRNFFQILWQLVFHIKWKVVIIWLVMILILIILACKFHLYTYICIIYTDSVEYWPICRCSWVTTMIKVLCRTDWRGWC